MYIYHNIGMKRLTSKTKLILNYLIVKKMEIVLKKRNFKVEYF